MLRKVVREIYAIEALKKVTRSDAYLKAAGDAAITPFAEVKELVMNPIDTISGIPKGALKVFNSTINNCESIRTVVTPSLKYILYPSYGKSFVSSQFVFELTQELKAEFFSSPQYSLQSVVLNHV